MTESHGKENSAANANPSLSTARHHHRRIHWKSAVVIVLITCVAVVIVRLVFRDNNANKFLGTSAVCGLGLVALAAWLLLGSGLRARVRLILAGVAAVLIAAAYFASPLVMRVEGVSGDIRPIVRWRWSPESAPLPVGDISAEATAELKATLADITAKDEDPQHYPQFLGPRRHPVVSGVQLARDWHSSPPREIWRQPIGAGHSAFAVVGDVAITQEQRGDEQLVVCYDLRTGDIRWSHADGEAYESFMGGAGPRATGTIDRGRVFTLNATGRLNCLDAATGEPLWPARDTLADAGANNLEWGKSNSPLLVDDLVICTGGAGGSSLIAYRQDSGEIAWQAGDDKASYCSPTLATLAGRRQILIVNAHSVAGIDPQDGKRLWQYEWPGPHPKASQPLPLPDDRLFLTAGYGLGCVMLQLNTDADGRILADELWANRNMKCKFSNLAVLDGHAYGLDDGIMACIDLETGSRRWKRGRFGHGQILLVGDTLLVLSEDGQLVMLDATTDGYRELGRIQALDGKTWNNPALAGTFLLLRNSEEAVCYKMMVAEESSASDSRTGDND